MISFVALTAAACMSTGNKGSTGSTSPGPQQSSSSALTPHRVLVGGRAAAPTETNAPGLQFSTGSLEVTLSGHPISISARDWNTISSTSNVPHDIGLSLDPNFHAADTTRHRFQYLADQIVQYAPSRFDPVGVAAAPVGKTLVTIVALINRTPYRYRLSGFKATVTVRPPVTTVGSATVFTGNSNALVVPGEDVYFLRLELPLIATRPSTATTTNYAFHYGRLYNCGTTPC